MQLRKSLEETASYLGDTPIPFTLVLVGVGKSMNPRRTTASCCLSFTPTPTRSSGSSSTRRTLVSQRLYVPSSRWCAFASLFPVD